MGRIASVKMEVWRPPGDPYPMPPLPSFAQGRIIAAGFEKLGMRVSSSPFAVNSVEYKGRAACVYDGWCDAGCPIGALVNPLVLDIPSAQAAGAKFLADSPVTHVLFDAKGRADALAYRAKDGSEHVAPGDLIILERRCRMHVSCLHQERVISVG